MQNFLTIAISNTVMACVLAILAVFFGRVRQNPQMSHALWLLVLVKLVTPPLANVPLPEFLSLEAPLVEEKATSPEGATHPVTTATATMRETSIDEATRGTETATLLMSESVNEHESRPTAVTEEPLSSEVTLSPIAHPLPDSTPAVSAETPEFFEPHSPAQPTVSHATDPTSDLVTATSSPVVPGDPTVQPSLLLETNVAFSSVDPPGKATTAPAAAQPPLTGMPHNELSAAQCVLCFWGVGSVLAFALLLGRCLRFRRIPGAATAASRELADTAASFSAQLGLPKCPRILVADVCIPPLVWGMSLWPVIVLPRTLLETLNTDQQRAVLMHELAHVRRRDHIVRWVEAIVLAVFWWNPLAWWARRGLREAEEECCDAWVVWALPESRKAYGQALLKTVEFLTESPRMPVVAGTAFGGSPFKRRIEMILNRPASRTMSRSSCALVVLLAAAVLPVAAQTRSKTPNVPADSPVTDESSLTPTNPVAADPPASEPPTAEEAADEPSSLTPIDESAPPVDKRATSSGAVTGFRKPHDPQPRNVNSTQKPRSIRFPGSNDPRDKPISTVRRDRNADATRTQTANEKQLAALARMEERIIRLEQIVAALAKSQEQLLKQGTPSRSTRETWPVPHVRTGTPATSAVRKPVYRDAPIPAPKPENRHAAVSPNGKVIASLQSDSRTTQVDLFDAKKGQRLSTFNVHGTADNVQFIDDQRLQIKGEKLLHLIRVPTGELITRESTGSTASSRVTNIFKPEPAAVTASGVPRNIPAVETASSVQRSVVVNSLVKKIEELEDKRSALEVSQRALDRDRALLRLEMKLEQTKLERAESELGRLLDAKAGDAEVDSQKLAVKEAQLLVEKASTVLDFKESELKTSQDSHQELASRIRKLVEDLVKRYPNHPGTKKYRDLLKEPGAAN